MEHKEFLQSADWLSFQEAAGRKVIPLATDDFSGNGILHTLPIVGEYLYIPRGPRSSMTKENLEKLMAGAKEKNARFIRIEPETQESLTEIQNALSQKIVKAPHDMQPREIFQIDISKSEEELLAQMKSKTRYNIRLAEKKGVRVFATREQKYQEAFLDLITATSDRKGITPHPRSYYEKFFAAFPEGMCELFVAEYEGEVLAANLVLFFENTATYLHGGSGNMHRDVMAPFLLQWEQIKEAKKRGCTLYDFGGIKTQEERSSWAGITRFKTGFAPAVLPLVYPGSYDIVLASLPYTLYRILQKVKSFVS